VPEHLPGQILVVDDDPFVAATLVELLGHHGYTVVRAESGEQALDMLDHHAVDLVLLDVRLPGMNGFETCARLRETRGPALPVLILTAYGDPVALSQGFEAGADDFLQKPVDTPTLLLKVRAFIRFKALHDEMVRTREEAQARARNLAQLHEASRDWSLIAEPEEFNRTLTEHLARLIGAPVLGIALYEPATKTMVAALPVHGLSDEQARALGYVVQPEYRGLLDFRSGRAYVSNKPRTDPRLLHHAMEAVSAESLVLVPMMSEGRVLGLLAAMNKPGGFTDADVQLLSIFAGPAASFLRSRQIFNAQRRHAERLERMADIIGAMAATAGRSALLELAVSRIQKDLRYERVAFHAPEESGSVRLEFASGAERPERLPADTELLRWALRGAMPLRADESRVASEVAIPVRAGDRALGVLEIVRVPGEPFSEDEINLLSALAGQLAVALEKAASTAETERMARQMATLYELGLETGALRDLRLLFDKATEEAGRLIKADHASALRLNEADGTLQLFTTWSRDPVEETRLAPVFRLGEGVAGRVARDGVPALVNDVSASTDYIARAYPVGRLLCVPLTYYDREREQAAIFGTLNATRRPGSPSFTRDDLDYLTRFAGQLSIAVANSMAFAAERERSEQLALVNTLIREIAGNLSRERILDAAVRRIHEAFQYPVVLIVVPEADDGPLRIAAASCSEPMPAGSASFPRAAGIPARALRERRTVLVTDVSQDPEYVCLFASSRSAVAVPIVSGDDVVAVLNVEGDSPRTFDRGQVITLETLADGIGIILRNAELYQALERTNAKLVELDRTKSEVVNIVAHDFRAPLAGVLGHAELLEWKPNAPRQERVESARAIVQAATHMASLVDKTLKTTRLETGHFPFEFGVIDLGAALRDVLARLPEDSQRPLATEIPEDPLPCWADRDRVAEVLENLLSNAVKYSPDGGPIHVSVACEREVVSVRVADKGVGIDSADLGRLFKPFSRVRNRRTAQVEGSGLGLYICERIVRAHGGRMGVESEPSKGSTFYFSLPMFGAAAQTRPPRVVVAAGDEGTRREVRRVAEALGYGTHEVADGVEALEAAIRLVPSAVILDRILPRLRAEEVAERLKDHHTTMGVPLVALAAAGDMGQRSALFKACVPKPLDRKILEQALSSLRPS
jgi:signal transduction histidine kinase/DNA-binding response OmpR family regulator